MTLHLQTKRFIHLQTIGIETQNMQTKSTQCAQTKTSIKTQKTRNNKPQVRSKISNHQK